MTPKRFMLVAGEPSGDTLAAELANELRATLMRQFTYSPNVQPLYADLAPRFFGAGGPRMAAAGVELAFDLTQHSVVGLVDVVKNYFKFARMLRQLVALAEERQPHAIVCVDFSGFNRRLAAAIQQRVRARRGAFNNWQPKIIQYISPQVWASREGRVYQLARDYDMLLSIFPFEKEWYAARVPRFHVEFIGHPMIDRYKNVPRETPSQAAPLIVLLPGSRRSELERHLPVMLDALTRIQTAIPGVQAAAILPNDTLAGIARAYLDSALRAPHSALQIQVGGLPQVLSRASVAIASTGTVTMECAFFGVPAVTLYKSSWINYEIGKRLIRVKSLTMPNLLAGKEVFPEFIQNAATSDHIAKAAVELLRNPSRRENVQAELTAIIASLGGPGATRRAAEAILKLL